MRVVVEEVHAVPTRKRERIIVAKVAMYLPASWLPRIKHLAHSLFSHARTPPFRSNVNLCLSVAFHSGACSVSCLVPIPPSQLLAPTVLWAKKSSGAFAYTSLLLCTSPTPPCEPLLQSNYTKLQLWLLLSNLRVKPITGIQDFW